jgi:hypothetical protein
MAKSHDFFCIPEAVSRRPPHSKGDGAVFQYVITGKSQSGKQLLIFATSSRFMYYPTLSFNLKTNQQEVSGGTLNPDFNWTAGQVDMVTLVDKWSPLSNTSIMVGQPAVVVSDIAAVDKAWPSHDHLGSDAQ